MLQDSQIIYNVITTAYDNLVPEYGETVIREYVNTAPSWIEGQPASSVAQETDVSDAVNFVKDLALAISAWITLIRPLLESERSVDNILELTKEWDIPKKKKLIKALLNEIDS